MTQGVIFLKAPYSPTNISINWNDVIFLRASKQYRIQGSKGRVYSGSLRIDSTDTKKVIVTSNDSTFYLDRTNIEQISDYLSATAQDKLTLKVDLGYTLTKVDNTQQFSFGTNLDYKIKKWEFSLNSSIFATKVGDIGGGRGDLSTSARYILPKNWFFIAQSSLSYSTEQDVSRRFTPLLGTGTS